MKQYAPDRKWTTGRSRVVRPTDQTKFLKGARESLKMVFDKLPLFARKKKVWEK